MRHILKSVAPYILNLITMYCFKTHSLHVEQEQAGADQFKIFLLKSTNQPTCYARAVQTLRQRVECAVQGRTLLVFCTETTVWVSY